MQLSSTTGWRSGWRDFMRQKFWVEVARDLQLVVMV